ncbi:MAG: type II toxin-antitoxin system VapC family toxin [Chloroflexi bacterium]|nr:type II toxin-antitoxin system VapC family toxin [Chloroflexota bacterium]MYE31796.1 type II toxin-antitoxin system VapC family toxin [Chloroflexota bacterium]
MILIDSDVLLDVALRQEPFFRESATFLLEAERSPEPACIAWHSVSNVYYVARRRDPDADARGFILSLLEWAAISPTSTESVRYAASLPMDDFEDALQVAAAEACGARHIVTRNLRDYERSPIRAIGPQEALGEAH